MPADLTASQRLVGAKPAFLLALGALAVGFEGIFADNAYFIAELGAAPGRWHRRRAIPPGRSKPSRTGNMTR